MVGVKAADTSEKTKQRSATKQEETPGVLNKSSEKSALRKPIMPDPRIQGFIRMASVFRVAMIRTISKKGTISFTV